MNFPRVQDGIMANDMNCGNIAEVNQENVSQLR
jgi:hypothetical protein